MTPRLPSPILAALLVGAAAAGPPPEVLPVEWPSSDRHQYRVATGFVALRPVRPREERAPLEELLRRPPFRSDGHRVLLDLRTFDPETAAVLVREARSGAPRERLDRMEVHRAVEARYGSSRVFPEQYGELLEDLGVGEDPRWHEVPVRSLVSASTRFVRFPAEVVLDAALESRSSGAPRGYPVGTTFLAEEREGGHLQEAHVLRKGADQEWSFALYDQDGRRRPRSPHSPRFRVPTTCAACHQNPVRLPPFRDFPGESPPFQGFQPEVEVELDAAEVALVERLRAPGPPADRVLGRYAGLVAVHLRRAARDDALTGWEVAAWERVEEALGPLP